jgi:hypothetical protein
MRAWAGARGSGRERRCWRNPDGCCVESTRAAARDGQRSASVGSAETGGSATGGWRHGATATQACCGACGSRPVEIDAVRIALVLLRRASSSAGRAGAMGRVQRAMLQLPLSLGAEGWGWSHFLTGSWLCWVCQCGVLPSVHSGGRWTVHVKSVSPGCCTDLQTLEPHGLLLVGTNADGVPRGGLERVLAVSTSLAQAHQASRGLASDLDGSRRLRARACSGSSQMKPRCLLVELSTDAEETGW